MDADAGDDGSGGTPPTFTVQPTAEQLRAAFMADLFPDQFGNIHGGFDLGMPFVLDLKIDAGSESIRVIKRALYWALPVSDQQVPNQNPVMASLVSYPDRDPATLLPFPPDAVTTVEPGTPFEVKAGTKVWFEPARAEAEPYWTTVIDANTHQAVPLQVEKETLRYRFFATAGLVFAGADVQRAAARRRRHRPGAHRIPVQRPRRLDRHGAGHAVGRRPRRPRRRVVAGTPAGDHPLSRSRAKRGSAATVRM